jgi:hypothetical protein
MCRVHFVFSDRIMSVVCGIDLQACESYLWRNHPLRVYESTVAAL